MWRSDKTKEKSFGFWGSKWWKGKYMGKLTEDKGYFGKVCADSNQCQFLVLVIMFVFLLLVQERGEDTTSQRETDVLILGKWGKVESSFCVCCFLIVFRSK